MRKKFLVSLTFVLIISANLTAIKALNAEFRANPELSSIKNKLKITADDHKLFKVKFVSLDYHNFPEESKIDQTPESVIYQADILEEENWQDENTIPDNTVGEGVENQDVSLPISELSDSEIDITVEERANTLMVGEEVKVKLPPKTYHVPDIPMVENRRVKAFIKMYTGRKRDVFKQAIARSPQYMTMIHRIFKEHGLPLNLAFLAVVESNFNPNARSRAKATGLWQFMGYTGKAFGLNRSWWHDDRFDPERSTVAAAKYLKQLHKQFKGDWELALAAYNTGGGRVRREIRKAKRRGKAQNFWALRLPRETRGYVPAFYAVATIFNDLEAYGFELAPKPNEEILKQVVSVPGGVSLKQVAALLKTDLKYLSALNPRLKRGITPAIFKEFEIALPPDVVVGAAEYQQLSLQRKQFWKYYKIRKGETLWSLSRKFQIPIKKIKSFNQMRRSFLRIGQKIMLPLPSDWAPKKYKKIYNPPKPAAIPGLNYVHVVVQGDTLWSISNKFNLPIGSIRRWNRQALRSRFLKIGTQLKLKVPVKVTLAI